MISGIKNWFSADTFSGRHTAKGNIWTDPMNNGDKCCALLILFLCLGGFVFVILDFWF